MGRIVGFAHFGWSGQSDHAWVEGSVTVTLGWGGVTDPLVGSMPVVVEPEPVQELLEMVEIPWWPLVGKPFFEGAVEPFQFAQGLGVIGRRVDELHPEVGETGFEEDLDLVETTGEGQPVVG